MQFSKPWLWLCVACLTFGRLSAQTLTPEEQNKAVEVLRKAIADTAAQDPKAVKRPARKPKSRLRPK